MLLLAEKVGYYAIAVRPFPLIPGGDFAPFMDDPALVRETISRSKQTGISIYDVEGIRLNDQYRRGIFDRFLAVGGELGAQVLSVICDDPDEKRLTDSFAGLCDDAAPYHLTVSLEFMPYSMVPDFKHALRVIRGAQRPNARIILDFLHVHRSHMSNEEIAAIPPGCLSHAQLCDAPAQIPTSRDELVHTARYARLLPGSGGIDVRGMFEALPEDLPLSIEVPNIEQRNLVGAQEWARRSLLATQKALET